MSHNYCTSCGMQVMSSMRICPSCGNRSFSATAPSLAKPDALQASSLSQGVSTTSNQGFVPTPTSINGIAPGVKGWLAFLCVSLTILTPLVGAGQLMAEWQGVKPYLDTLPMLKNAVIVETLATVAVLMFAVYAGLQLWQIKPNAVATAKTFLLVQLAYALIVPGVVAAMLGLPELIPTAIKVAFRCAVYTAIWYPYLLKSKRVRVTYP